MPPKARVQPYSSKSLRPIVSHAALASERGNTSGGRSLSCSDAVPSGYAGAVGVAQPSPGVGASAAFASQRMAFRWRPRVCRGEGENRLPWGWSKNNPVSLGKGHGTVERGHDSFRVSFYHGRQGASRRFHEKISRFRATLPIHKSGMPTPHIGSLSSETYSGTPAVAGCDPRALTAGGMARVRMIVNDPDHNSVS